MMGSRTLRIGASGEDVRALQRVLGIVADGIFGPQTAGALAAWQEARGLLADGIAGPGTWRAMGVGSPAAQPVFMPPGPTALAPMVARALRGMPGTFEPNAWAAVLAPDMERAAINTPARVAIYLSNIHHETGGLRKLVESLSYSAEGMMRVWPSRFPTVESTAGLVHNPRALAERVYGGRMGNTRPGDGWAARGRGCYQTTGMDNYRALAAATGEALELLTGDDSPLLARPGASHSAALFWTSMGFNAMADQGQSRLIRLRGNGGTVGMDQVMALEAAARQALA